MKVDSPGLSPSGKRCLTLRVGASELMIIRGMLKQARQHTPCTPATRKTLERMKAMAKCLSSAPVAQWIEHGDSTSDNAGSIPAEGTFERVVELADTSDLSSDASA